MKIGHISDTHASHGFIYKIEPCDILIHSGDITNKGEWSNTESFLTWFQQQPAKYRIFIAGNHDFNFDINWRPRTEQGRTRHKPIPYTQEDVDYYLNKFPDIIYLNDTSIVIEGIKIHGSPIIPWFHDWAFNRMVGVEIQQHWDLIPEDTNILITHGPPFGYGDKVLYGGHNVGCHSLLEKIKSLKQLKLCMYGHIHEGYGTYELDGKILSNGSSLDINYQPVNKPLYYNI